jgi:hypothetical protein
MMKLTETREISPYVWCIRAKIGWLDRYDDERSSSGRSSSAFKTGEMAQGGIFSSA